MNENIGLLIVANASKYLGQKEKPSNSGFQDPSFQSKLEKTGWKKGESWCAYFAELVYRETYDMIVAYNSVQKEQKEKVCNQIQSLFSGGSLQTYANFDKSNWVTRKAKPAQGGLLIWQMGSTWQGHTSIIISVDEKANTITTIDGNTNAVGGREGNVVAIKTRKWKAAKKKDGLNVFGYIEPFNPLNPKSETFEPFPVKDKVIAATYI